MIRLDDIGIRMTTPSNVPRENGVRETEPHERRKVRRWKVFKQAQLVLKSGLVPCAIHDISEHGARLQIPANITLPETFQMLIRGDEIMVTARRVWSTLDQAGVRFIDR